MRWRFHDKNDAEESLAVKETLGRVDAWWRAFQTQIKMLDALFSGNSQWDLAEWMAENLQVIDAGLMWEFGPAINGPGHRLVITPESSRHLRPLTETIIDRAPRLAGWEFYPYRLAESVESAEATVEARTGGTLADVVVDARIGEHNLIDLTFRSPRTRNSNDEQAFNDAFVATESLLGEELLDKWVGAIEVAPVQGSGGLLGAFRKGKKQLADHDSTGRSGIRLDQLKDVIDSLIVCLRDQLPRETPILSLNPDDDSNWSCLEMNPDESDDYPNQSDLIAAVTLNPTIWMAAHCGRPFCSERFSRNGEVFVYLKIDGRDGLDESDYSGRDHIEAAITKVLISDSLGGVIGGGTGIRYSYVDLVLTDLERGITLIRNTLRGGRIPNRSWILFFDADLCGEWIGIYDDTPVPPAAAPEEDE